MSPTPALDKFRRDHGNASATVVTVLAIPPLLLGAIVGVSAGLLLALPGLAVAMVVAIPHWLRREPTP